MALLRVIAYVWASPNTLLGILFGLFSFQRPRLHSGVLMFDSNVRGFIWLVGAFNKAAVTFGHVVLSNRRVEGLLKTHEMHHVRQYERLGFLYLPLYVLIWVFTGYRKHPFEEAARLAEFEASKTPGQ